MFRGKAPKPACVAPRPYRACLRCAWPPPGVMVLRPSIEGLTLAERPLSIVPRPYRTHFKGEGQLFVKGLPWPEGRLRRSKRLPARTPSVEVLHPPTQKCLPLSPSLAWLQGSTGPACAALGPLRGLLVLRLSIEGLTLARKVFDRGGTPLPERPPSMAPSVCRHGPSVEVCALRLNTEGAGRLEARRAHNVWLKNKFVLKLSVKRDS